MKKLIFAIMAILTVSGMFNACNDNAVNSENNFQSVTIGEQIWMKKNLDVDHYRNGDLIPEVTDIHEWAKLTTGAWCYYNNDPKNGKIYGKLYNWYAVNDPRGLAPDGWHIASDMEWGLLSGELGGDHISGQKLKEKGTAHWEKPNEATNKSGFTALPGGFLCCNNFAFHSIKTFGKWWTSTETNQEKAFNIFLSNSYSGTILDSHPKNEGYSVR